jgi:hypothetical protein
VNSGIPFIKIADRVEVEVDLFGKRVSGPPMNLKKIAKGGKRAQARWWGPWV